MTHISKQERKAIMQDWSNGLYHEAYLKAHEVEQRKYEDVTYDSAKFSLDIDDFHGEEYEADAIVDKEVEVELLEPDYLYERDPEYSRILGMYVDEYDNEINMVDAIDTESDFDVDEINDRYWMAL